MCNEKQVKWIHKLLKHNDLQTESYRFLIFYKVIALYSSRPAFAIKKRKNFYS